MTLIVITLLDSDGTVQVHSQFDPEIMQADPTPAAIAAAKMLATVTDSDSDEPLIQLLS